MPKTRDELVTELAELIISSVNLRHRKKEEITGDTALMQTGLNLDSLDILEIVVSVEQKYNVKISGPEQGPIIFRTVGTLADFLREQNI
jgi:acyl carrier protein